MGKLKVGLIVVLIVAVAVFAGLIAGCAAEEIAYYSVTYEYADGGFVIGDTVQTVSDGSKSVEVEAVPQYGYVFDSWNDGLTFAKRSDTVTADVAYTATFKKITFTVNYENEEGGSIIGEAVQKICLGGDSTPVKAVADNDHVFLGWSDGVPTAERTDCNVCANLNVKPIFAPKQWTANYSLSIENAAGLSLTEYVADLFEGVKVTVTPNLGYKFVGWSDGVTEPTRIDYYNGSNLEVQAIIEIDALELPVIMVNTENNQLIPDKENYVNCTVSVLNTDEDYCFDLVNAGIRLRGNSTLGYPKKSYRIKFDKKQDLFGFGSYKSWVLLAMYQDFSGIKDYAAFTFAESIKKEESKYFVPQSRHVEIYLNGDYIGLYLLTEQVQENEGRVSVEEDFDETLIEVPFLVEWDENAYNEGMEGVDWFRIANEDSGVTSYYAIKYPEADQRYSQEQFDFIKNYINIVNTICHNPDTTKSQFEEYIDLSSFIDYYLVQEFMSQGEINWKSIFMSRTLNGKLVMGPVWDFDWSATGPIGYGSTWGSTGWLSSTNWFAYMMKNEWFFDEVCNRWNEITKILNEKISYLKEFKYEITEVSERNAILWDFIDDNNPINDFDGYYDKIIKFFEDRLAWMNSQLIN